MDKIKKVYEDILIQIDEQIGKDGTEVKLQVMQSYISDLEEQNAVFLQTVDDLLEKSANEHLLHKKLHNDIRNLLEFTRREREENTWDTTGLTFNEATGEDILGTADTFFGCNDTLNDSQRAARITISLEIAHKNQDEGADSACSNDDILRLHRGAERSKPDRESPSPRQMGEGALDSDPSSNSSGGAAAAPFTPGLRSPIRGHTMSADDQEDPGVTVMELKEEVEMLMKEVCDKQKLLSHAAETLHLVKQQHIGDRKNLLEKIKKLVEKVEQKDESEAELMDRELSEHVEELEVQLAKAQNTISEQQIKLDRTVQNFMLRRKKVNSQLFNLVREVQRMENYINYLESKPRKRTAKSKKHQRELRQQQAENTGKDPKSVMVPVPAVVQVHEPNVERRVVHKKLAGKK